MFLLFLITLPLFTSAHITVNITVESNRSEIFIKHSGSDKKVVTDTELKLFNVTTDKLMKGMRIELGKTPDDVFLQDPTPNGNIFQKYKWEPVSRSIKVHKAKIVDMISEDIVLLNHEFINNSTLHIKSNRHMYQIVENTAQSQWYKDGYPDDNAFYVLDLNFTYGHLKYKNRWRSDQLHSARMSFGETKKGNIFIRPYESVMTDLIATKIILIIELVYKAELVGAVVANYARLYGKYHFWAPSIQDIMKAAGMNNQILTREEIEVRCFIKPRLQETVKTGQDRYGTHGVKGAVKRKKKIE